MGEWEKADAAKGAPAATPSTEDKAPAAAPAPGSDATEAVEGKPETAPEAAPAPDLSWLPENLREKASQLDPELAEWAKGNVLRQSDYTKKTQALAVKSKDADAVKAKADLWAKLETNPQLADYAYRVLRGEAQVPGSEPAQGDDDVDLTAADNATIKKYVREQARIVAKEIAAAEISERVELPVQERSAIFQSLLSFATENKVSEDSMLAAITKAEAHAEEIGVKVTPANVVALVKPFVESGKPAPVATSKPAAPPVPGGLAKVASPSSRSTATVPPPMPRHRVEKREPRTGAERTAEAVALMREQGFDVTEQDLEALFRK